ncbi:MULTISPECIES: TetR/AcrR family transcriptional regulator [unclassified Bradyrhizobium]|uniref:TetR/AcrR family transcriptional regulator n=1 Tax=unclassified Bradyrhizobium TaxID=2631580 RepID=UPI00247834ED|nr:MULTISPECIES: TetR/AcrR family transcriptional regulator [unclassified Bradyrhizobium]WGR72083.1 TetR/AcrR family transcriptional regulator [Bradyrhizobium sp. ISRA426]WGR76917.1 TetR/AcrR family transcriptional regulator [Bradyrhizobium sp. ISRA430]WGR87322.1 TetR/AcrR family transcriptional regulator [Bradyrhizobium sp. ISRA432]
MAQEKSVRECRPRGRPQLRSDEETKQIVFDAARHAFAVDGYAATSTEELARLAGISTRTLYRLFPGKAALFEAMCADRLERLLADVHLKANEEIDIETGLRAALLACTDLALDPEVVALQRMVLQESAAFPELAANFYKNGIARTVRALAHWLRVQVKKQRIALDDVDEAAGMLIGMVASAPQRAAIYGGIALPSRKQIERRVHSCATLFLNGCRAASP